MLILQGLTACAPAVIAGAAAGGGYILANKEEEILPPRMLPLSEVDRTITREIAQKIAEDRYSGDMVVTVETRDGVVSLTGRAANEETRGRAIAIAESTKGVKRVDTDIVIQ